MRPVGVRLEKKKSKEKGFQRWRLCDEMESCWGNEEEEMVVFVHSVQGVGDLAFESFETREAHRREKKVGQVWVISTGFHWCTVAACGGFVEAVVQLQVCQLFQKCLLFAVYRNMCWFQVIRFFMGRILYCKFYVIGLECCKFILLVKNYRNTVKSAHSC